MKCRSQTSALNWRARKSTRPATASKPGLPTISRLFLPRILSPAPTTTRSPRFTASIRLAPTSRARLGRWNGPMRDEDTMSVDIEVELESAAGVELPAQEPLKQEPRPKPLSNPRVRRALIAAGGLLFAVLVGLFIYF